MEGYALPVPPRIDFSKNNFYVLDGGLGREAEKRIPKLLVSKRVCKEARL